MSAAISDVQPDPEQTRPAPGPVDGPADDPTDATAAVVVRRNAGLAALVGAAASAIAIAYLWRAIGSAASFDWVLCLLMSGVATFHLANLVDARTPLLVADDLGVRVRLGHQWRGLPWDGVREVVVHPSRGVLRDGRLVFSPHSLGRALDGLDTRGRRAAALNQRLYGGALAVPMGLSTRVSARGSALAGDLAALARGRADVVVGGDERDGVAEASDTSEAPVHSWSESSAPETLRDDRPGDDQPGDDQPSDDQPSDDQPSDDQPSDDQPGRDSSSPRRLLGSRKAARRLALLREDRHGRRAELTLDAPVAADREEPGGPAVPDPAADADDGRVRPIAILGDPVESLVVDDFVTEPAYDPVIGPELAAARTRVGLSVDELADRTRIRPHVIESIEVDDFAPCGGDFYARGHLRTLARVLGRDPTPLLEQFDTRYATAPISARRVFEAELATGMTGSMRSTSGGPNWALMAGAVLALVLVWGVVRLFASDPAEQLQNPAPVLNGSAGVAGPAGPRMDPAPAAAEPVRVTLLGAEGGSHVLVRDRTGAVVWAGEIVLGEQRTVSVTPPVKVRAEDGGSIAVALDGADLGVLGRPGQPGLRTLHRDDARPDAGAGASPDPR